MKIVIDIPDEVIRDVNKTNEENYENVISWYDTTLYCAIKNGITLPAEHGNLVDINDVATALIYSGICDSAKCGEVKDVLSKIPIIVEGSAE